MEHPRLDGVSSRLRGWRDGDIESIYSVTDDPVIPLISEIPGGRRPFTVTAARPWPGGGADLTRGSWAPPWPT